MKILNANQIRQIDQDTIAKQNIASHELMESAACALRRFLCQHFKHNQHFVLFAGNGNNGGDALALARLLCDAGYRKITIYLTAFSTRYSTDNQYNQKRLNERHIPVTLIEGAPFPDIASDCVIIDALFGTGLNGTLKGEYAQLVQHINTCTNDIIAIDLPSGLYSDKVNNETDTIIQATTTLTFQIPKWALFQPQNAPFIGKWQLLNIGLDEHAIKQMPSDDTLITHALVKHIYQPRKPWAHKGSHGHALIIAGSYGKLGALQLSTSACLRSGSGLTTCYAPKCAFQVMQSAQPSAMMQTDAHELHITDIPDISAYDSIAVGPGIGDHEQTIDAIGALLKQSHHRQKKLVIDADALNIIARQPQYKKWLQPNCILTPHPKEFARLAGAWSNDDERLEKLRRFASEHQCVVVLKGRHSAIATQNGGIYVNNTGNAGLAKGGSGDTLTGIITALLAQGYSSVESAILGVYCHGLAADIAVEHIAMPSLMAEDVCRHLSDAFNTLAPAPIAPST